MCRIRRSILFSEFCLKVNLFSWHFVPFKLRINVKERRLGKVTILFYFA